VTHTPVLGHATPEWCFRVPKITLTDFVDVVTRSGTTKITKIAQIKNRPSYTPQTDFYKAVRECIVEMHEKGLPKSHLSDMLSKLKDAKKITNYPEIAAGYTKWLGKKDLPWFKPPHEIFSAHGVDVIVNPEVGLRVSGVPHIIKLYFKGESLNVSKVQIVAHLMEITLRPLCKKDETRMAVLDTRSAKLHTPNVPVERLTAGLRGELAYIAAVWDDL
jgi:hypothetical protein